MKVSPPYRVFSPSATLLGFQQWPYPFPTNHQTDTLHCFHNRHVTNMKLTCSDKAKCAQRLSKEPAGLLSPLNRYIFSSFYDWGSTFSQAASCTPHDCSWLMCFVKWLQRPTPTLFYCFTERTQKAKIILYV